MNSFLIKLLASAAADPKIQAFVDGRIDKLATVLKRELLPDLAALFPTFGAAVVKAAFNRIPALDNITDSINDIATGAVEELQKDPDIPGLSEIIDVSEMARKWLEGLGKR
ncbi:hypothetical protein SEA_LEOPARD_18 [Mycobacterium phage Leopard]|uniref:Uncharacterized protein n=1 Tax=Mycobacterium phage Onyinye TaxID=2686235 RepID=A0A6B9LF96_9CAUD|nr:hypothetical protein PP339_gp019 [Mycobacterium phage Onyinye]QHB37425.1 hypothetical protein SEA_ONYINYE_19 [Mycobacterium phage Onyinye]UOW92896.1 hypothetical protein SEA_LEOPARD_18 [Mycobacterium phage Leopard]WKW85180.1 hypothetical protein SEA_AIKOY__18 [Mycobacterium phage Aikoy]